jgi:hypothetical protein
VLNWVFWQMANQGPMTGNFGHFFVYAPADKGEARDYGAARYGMETQRLCDVLDKVGVICIKIIDTIIHHILTNYTNDAYTYLILYTYDI